MADKPKTQAERDRELQQQRERQSEGKRPAGGERTEAKRDEAGRRMSPEEVRAQDESTGKLEDGRVMLTNDSGEVKKVTEEEWGNEEFQADLLKKGWKVVGGGEKES